MVPYNPYSNFMRAWNAAQGVGPMVYNAVDDWYMNGEKGRVMFNRAVDDLMATDIVDLADMLLLTPVDDGDTSEHQRSEE